jgi:hydrogenase-4 component F
MGAGVFTVKYGTKEIAGLRDGLRLLPWSGPLFLLAVFALSALPPSGIFRSEFQIVAGGLASGGYAAAAILVVLVTVAFFGLATSATSMLLTPVRQAPAAGRPPAAGETAAAGAGVMVRTRTPARQALARGEPSAWMVVPVLAGLAVLLILGIHPPGELTDLITRGAAQLGAP